MSTTDIVLVPRAEYSDAVRELERLRLRVLALENACEVAKDTFLEDAPHTWRHVIALLDSALRPR
jgi:hypothetical protein